MRSRISERGCVYPSVCRSRSSGNREKSTFSLCNGRIGYFTWKYYYSEQLGCSLTTFRSTVPDPEALPFVAVRKNEDRVSLIDADPMHRSSQLVSDAGVRAESQDSFLPKNDTGRIVQWGDDVDSKAKVVRRMAKPRKCEM